MACDLIEQEEKQKAIEAAKKALLTGAATLKRNLLTGKIDLSGMNPASKNGMNDACIIAGVAAAAGTNADLYRIITATGKTPAEIIHGHGHSHGHGTQQHAH